MGNGKAKGCKQTTQDQGDAKKTPEMLIFEPQGPLRLGWDPPDQPGVPAQRVAQGDHGHRVQEEHHLLLQQSLCTCRP